MKLNNNRNFILLILLTAVCQYALAFSLLPDESIADVRKFPWLVKVFSFNGDKCSGTLVSPNYVLTAKHCLSLLKDVYLVYSPNDFKNPVGGTPVFFGQYGDQEKLAECITKRSTNCLNSIYKTGEDYALIKLGHPIKLNKYPKIEKIQIQISDLKNQEVSYLGYPAKLLGQVAMEKKCFLDFFHNINASISIKCIFANILPDEKGMSGGPLMLHDAVVGVVSGNNDFASTSNFPDKFFEIIESDFALLIGQ